VTDVGCGQGRVLLPRILVAPDVVRSILRMRPVTRKGKASFRSAAKDPSNYKGMEGATLQLLQNVRNLQRVKNDAFSECSESFAIVTLVCGRRHFTCFHLCTLNSPKRLSSRYYVSISCIGYCVFMYETIASLIFVLMAHLAHGCFMPYDKW